MDNLFDQAIKEQDDILAKLNDDEGAQTSEPITNEDLEALKLSLLSAPNLESNPIFKLLRNKIVYFYRRLEE